ncbi:MAG: membrane protein insertase YidC [Gammaproteobacteria bacterium]|nr:membrane protein insertase YidC [Gammaproteobacteria bacterium]
MDNKKLFLYALLGLIVFSLWNAWHGEHSQTQVNKTAPAQEVTQKAIKNNNDISVSSVPENRMIKIKTDVLALEVDKLNGSIVGAQLLKYAKKLGDHDHYVQILSSNKSNFYVVKNYLNINGKKQKIIFSSNHDKYFLSGNKNKLVVNLYWRSHGVKITKSFTFYKGSYAVGVDYNINNASGKTLAGILSAEIERAKPSKKTGLFGMHSYNGAAISSKDIPYQKVTFDDMDKTELDKVVKGGWVAMQQRYFVTAWVPGQNMANRYFSRKKQDIYGIGANSNFNIPVGKNINLTNRLYVGPEVKENLSNLAPNLDRTIDYGWLWLISMAIFWFMEKIYSVVGNWGWSIIIVTLVIKAAFYKLSEKSYVSMAKMKVLAPKLQELKKKYGDDKQKVGQATMELYKKEGVNPLGGCLPMLIQIPVFIGLYYVLLEAVQLRHAPFILWIHDLSAKDPYYILPLLMGASMFLTQKLNPPAPDPIQAKLMLYGMPIMFTVLFASFPAGLVLYWFMNNLLSVLQQWLILKRMNG